MQDVDALVADVAAVGAEYCKPGAPPLFLFGQSLGGLLALRAATRLPPLAGVVLQSPTIRMLAGRLPRQQRALRLLARVAPTLPAIPPTAPSSYHPSVAAARLREDTEDPLVRSGLMRLGTAAAVVAAADALLHDISAGGFARYTTPTFIQHGDSDSLVDPAGAVALSRACRTVRVQLVRGGHHDLLRERDAVTRETLHAALRWMLGHLPPAPRALHS